VLGEEQVRVLDDGLDLTVEPERASWINGELVAAGIAVSELVVRERDLEQVFFELTGEVVEHVG
jgi:ABC-2 type transport system ATP-binding protein